MMIHQDSEYQFLKSRSHQFAAQIKNRLSGIVNEDEFRPLRLMNGLYLEMHAYMLRVAIPYGTLSSNQLRQLAFVAQKYDRGYGHFTTRQNIQFNWLALEDSAAILHDLAEENLHAIQTSGNCIRSITSDPYAGATPDEVCDPRPTAELIRQWACLHPEFAFLGRKFKIAVTATDNDRAAIRVHDIGVQIIRNDTNELGYKIFVGGGLGRTPMVAETLAEFLHENELLAYLEATLRIYNRLGRRDNKYKARIKILTRELGLDRLRQTINKEYLSSRRSLPDTSPWLDIIKHQFVAPELAIQTTQENLLTEADQSDNLQFRRWLNNNLRPHKQNGYRIVNITLKGRGNIPGDISSEQMKLVADLADKYSYSEIRVTKNQNLVLPHVAEQDLYTIWQRLDAANLANANLELITDIVSCPGMDYCSLATARSIPIAQQISNYFHDHALEDEIGKISIKISGCINACGHHHIGQIGLLGLEKKGQEYYQIVLGGNDGKQTTIGKVTGPGFSSDEVIEAIQKIVETYLVHRHEHESFSDTQLRLGINPFKEALYDTH